MNYSELINIGIDESLVKDNILYISILFAAIIGKIKESSKSSLLTAWITYLMGTFFHELSHFIVSLVTLGKPVSFNVFPSKSVSPDGKIGYTLGSVSSKNMKWYNTFFISMAPLLLLPMSYYIYDNFFYYFDVSILTIFLYNFSIVSLLFSSIPSGVDFKNVLNVNLLFNLIIPISLVVIYVFYYEIIMNSLLGVL